MPSGLSYDPKTVLFAAFGDMKDFSDETDKQVEAIGGELSARELAGADTSFARAALLELRWRTKATSDLSKARQARTRLEGAVARDDAPGATEQDRDGSFAPGARRWFLKLDRSTDQLLARAWPWRIAPYFLEKIDDPVRMFAYLQDLTWCDVRRQGRDTRKELNLAFSVIARLVMRGGQAGYVSAPGFGPALERFIAEWQQPDTGFFGVTYVVDDMGREIVTRDLSLTFHVVRYVPHLVRDWIKLVDTLFALDGGPYPEGWLEGATMSNHNNYDVAEILHRAWRFLRPDQRVRAAALIAEMVDWCLANSVQADGVLKSYDTGDMVPDSYYFAAAFLDTVGVFDRSKRFWTERNLAGAEDIRTGMARELGRFHPRLTVVADALERLQVRKRSLSNAMI